MIPAYKRSDYLTRLLNSIAVQTYQDFEVVITDDSPDSTVEDLLSKFSFLSIRYFRNMPSLGTPANWNKGISLARGEWIKLMHDDDWFRSPHSLQGFADATTEGIRFVFSRYVNVVEAGGEKMPGFPSSWKKRIISQPLTLLAENVVGPPSVTLIHRSVQERYDERMKWRVDLDFYCRLLQQEKDFRLIDEPLVNVGISQSQVTNDCLNIPEVELPEGWLLLEKYGLQPLQNVLVYDAWWRILRNNSIRNVRQLQELASNRNWPVVIEQMVIHQQNIPTLLLNSGLFSKFAMFLSYLQNTKLLKGK